MFGHKRIPSREGGVEVVVEELATRMAALGHELTCYNRGGHHVSGEQFDVKAGKSYMGVRLKTVPTLDRKGLAAVTSSIFAALCTAFSDADVVHIHAEGPAFMCWLPKLFGKRVVVTVHGLDWQREKWKQGFGAKFIRMGEKMAVRYADEIIVLSRNVQNYFKNTYDRDTLWIPNGVNRPEIVPDVPNAFGIEKDEYFLFLGRLVSEKGIHYLVDAFQRVDTSKKLVIAGGASDSVDYAEELKRLAKKDERILFTGFVQGKPLAQLCSNAYVYVQPSDVEGMPLTLLEAMSYGNCCVVSDIPECTEVVADQAITFPAADVAALFSVFFALGSRGVIDSAVAGEPTAFWNACIRQAGIILVILLCLTVLRHLRDRLAADLERDWKKKLLHGLLHGEYAQVSGYHSAELLNRLNNDVQKVNDGVLSIVPNAAAMVTRLIAAVVVLGVLDARFTILIAALGAVVILATGMMRKKLKNLNKRVSEHNGKVSGLLQEVMEKLLMVQAMDVSDEVEHRADAMMAERYEVQRKRKNISLLTNTGISVMSYGAGFLALVWCALRLLRGQMSFGSLTAVIQLVNQLQSPFVGLSGVLPQYVAMVASAERLMELEAIQGEPAPQTEDPKELYQRMDAICARELSFSYDRDRILSGAEFALPKGAFAVITGPSGIGKSTLLKLFLGIFRPDSGSLYLNCGQENVKLDRSLRRLFAYVPQGNLLLSGTLRENLTIVKPDADEAQLQQAIYVSAIDEFLPQLPLGLDTPLGESGAGLSEGQAQRLAIARAVLGGAPVLLLDECTSALDAETERKVLSRIKALPGRTCIAVTHRPAAIALCDHRMEVYDGKIRIVK